ncbi:archaemetzincin [Marinigracilibium pacificum]|uniref:Archaemetzincin n=1 Tax=Marinigracilibium pacificum TaxID=2729599 RepID=A0A848J428_9BACT|nr:archaemetzincin [Marinigracilibium pacificum]NMM47932.1 hypothetical protein [Marinigracilibium pacificum]
MKSKLNYKLVILIVVLLLTSFGVFKSLKSRTIAIQPYGNFPDHLSKEVSSVISHQLNIPTVILPAKPVPPTSFINIKGPRYRADSILNIQLGSIPDSIDFILGVTNRDISFTKRDTHGNIKKPESKYKDWGIFGLAHRPGRSAIVSDYRTKTISQSKSLERLKKISIHEVGHNLGLKHCKSGLVCVMQDAAESIKTIDNVSLDLCSSCQNKLKIMEMFNFSF